MKPGPKVWLKVRPGWGSHFRATKRVLPLLAVCGALLIVAPSLSWNKAQAAVSQTPTFVSRPVRECYAGNRCPLCPLHGGERHIDDSGRGRSGRLCGRLRWRRLGDIYFVNGRDLYNRGISVRNALYHNNGNGTFVDVTEKAGVPGNAYGLGCVWGDYDNDGHPDLYVTQYGKNILYHNNGNGTFTDVTDHAGVGAMDFGYPFHTGATFFDYDRDSHLDLYVGGYANFGPASQRTCSLRANIRTSCRPTVYGGTPAVLYHNQRDGTFTNVTKAAGMYQTNGLNLAVGAGDWNEDGWPDLFVANDGLEASLYHNNRNGKFTNVAMQAGMALSWWRGNGRHVHLTR